MSTRCTIAYVPPFYIYSCCNSGWDIFLADNIADQPREGYNEDIRIGHDNLRKLYEELKKYFDEGAAYEKMSHKAESADVKAENEERRQKSNHEIKVLLAEVVRLGEENARLREALEYAKGEMLKGGEDFDYWAETKVIPEIERILEKSKDGNGE